MKPMVCVLVLLSLILAFPRSGQAQSEAGVPFLLISPSPEANSMGGTAVAMPRFDPTASVFSPAQVGLWALNSHVRGGFYLDDAGLPSGLAPLPDLSYTSWGTSAGFRLNDVLDLPFRVGVGLGYNRVDLSYGRFNVTSSSGPDVIGAFESEESAAGVTLGVGFEYTVRFGFGYTFRSIESSLAPIGTEQEQGSGTADVTAADYGFLLDIPLVTIGETIAAESLVIGWKARPFLDLSGGVAWNNVGDEIVYVDPDQADPFPRTARTGISIRGGVCIPEGPGWELVSAGWSREAEDMLVVRHDNGSWEYQSGLGDINMWENVIEGKTSGNVSLRSGWQFQLGEVFTLRGGSVKSPRESSRRYDTRGYTVQLAGLLKGLCRLLEDHTPPWLAFARNHVDIRYHSADYEEGTRGTDLTSYSGLTLSLHTWPW